ncbi:MAG TPA: pyridoxal-phosphate dependent enzyme [Baekduia sp.]|nr:pyridoxal-phosphate dependent enzyme [Baekduia sp.]
MLPDRLALVDLPTPLHELPRFSAAVGARVLCKRDDVLGPGFAGNKVRKLERTLAQARAQGADAVVTLGAAQSNHARATAAACARLGWRCVLVLGGDEPHGPPSGNVLLDRLFGAELVHAGTTDWAALAERAETEAARLRAAGAHPVVLPAGGSTPVGAAAFADAYDELLAQLDARGVETAELVHATSTGGTHAGLVAGRLRAGRGPRIRGVLVIEDLGGAIGELHAWLAREAAALHGAPAEVAAADLLLDHDQLGAGYGAPTPEGLAAIRLLAETEAIVCDPVYSGKALAGLIHRARSGAYGEAPVVFWHTGGWPAAFAPDHAASLTRGR